MTKCLFTLVDYTIWHPYETWPSNFSSLHSVLLELVYNHPCLAQWGTSFNLHCSCNESHDRATIARCRSTSPAFDGGPCPNQLLPNAPHNHPQPGPALSQTGVRAALSSADCWPTVGWWYRVLNICWCSSALLCFSSFFCERQIIRNNKWTSTSLLPHTIINRGSPPQANSCVWGACWPWRVYKWQCAVVLQDFEARALLTNGQTRSKGCIKIRISNTLSKLIWWTSYLNV